ncbi:hypothetical protein Taro_041649, partial [Colocasia esculenta]|nr:hypothetical protein [Colocasia esculenta]
GLELEERRLELDQAFFPRVLLLLGLLSTSSCYSTSVPDPEVASLREQLASAVARAEVVERDLSTRTTELQGAITQMMLAGAEVAELTDQLSELCTQASQRDPDLPREAAALRVAFAVEHREGECERHRWEEEWERLSHLGVSEQLLREAEDRYRHGRERAVREGWASAYSASFIVTSSKYQRNIQEGRAAQRSTDSRTSMKPLAPRTTADPGEAESSRHPRPAESCGESRRSVYPRRKILDSSPEASEKSTSSSSSSESSQPTKKPPSKPLSVGKTILKPRVVDLDDSELIVAFPEVLNFFKFQSWQSFISEFRIIYPRLVQEFYQNLECTEEGYKSKVKGIVIDMPTDLAATIFKIPDEGEDYHNFEFNLHEVYTIITGLPADESDPKQTHVTKFNTNTFPPVLRLTRHMLTTIITPQGGGRDRLTDIQRFVMYCMSKDIKINLHVIMYQIISETTRADFHRSLPYAAYLTQVFNHFGVSLENEKSEKIPKSNIYCFKHVQKFMGFRIVGDQVRRGPAAVDAPMAQEDQPLVQEEQPPVPEEQPPAPEDQPQVHEDQPPINEDQPHVADEVAEPFIAPHSPQPQPSSSMNLEPEIPSSSPPPPVQASSSFGRPSVPPELYTFLNDKFDALNTSIQSMSENFELRIQRLENSVSARFIEQKAASDQATQRFNRLIGTLADASVELKEHQKELEIVLKGILANSQADVFNSKETLSQISKTRLSFAHLVDDLESMKNLSAHIDEEMSALKKEFKVLNRPGWSAGSSSSSQPMSNEFTAIQAAMDNISCQGSVDTTINGVDTMTQSKGRNVKKISSSVDTSPGQVDTREPSQKACCSDSQSRSTPNAGRAFPEGLFCYLGHEVDTESSQVDTRDLSQGFVLPVWESVSTHLMGRSTHSGISMT